jgi:integrase
MKEALNLTINDIDSGRRRLIVRNGKGQKDREIPLPENTLGALRKYWASHRNPKYIFPARTLGKKSAPTSARPIAKGAVQVPLQKVLKELGITKRVTPHTFRHSYATHLLDAGVSIRHVQMYLGHAKVETTCIYLHLTKDASGKALVIIDALMEGFTDGKDKPNI